MQALVCGETWSLPSSSSHLNRNDVWAWHIIGGKDEIEDKSNCQCDRVRLPCALCTGQEAVIIRAISRHKPEKHQPTTREAGPCGTSAKWPRQNWLLLQGSYFSGWWSERDLIPLLQGGNVTLLSNNTDGLSELALGDLKWDSCYADMNKASLSKRKEECFRNYEIRTSNSRELEWKIGLYTSTVQKCPYPLSLAFPHLFFSSHCIYEL